MKLKSFLSFAALLVGYTLCSAQVNETKPDASPSLARNLTIEPGIGIHTNFGTDVLIANLIQWNPNRRLSFAAHSSYGINNVTQRNFSHIKTNYNFSLSQKLGVGTSLYRQKSSSTFFLMAGVKYTSYQESLEHPNLDKVSVSIQALSLDYGVLYSFKRGWKKYFFTSRFYLPLHPWLTKGAHMDNIQGTLRDIALEFGVGIKIK
jgi:hypothetical protein